MSPDLAGALPDPLTWMAIGVAVATALTAAIAAATLARERRRGSAGWMAARAVPRPSIALSWFVAFSLLLAVGLAPACMVVWLALEPFLASGAGGLIAAAASTACAGLAAIAFGILAGAALPRMPATGLTMMAAGAMLLPPAMGAEAAWWLPADGLRVLAELDTATRPVADALRAGGAALGLAAGLLVLAVVAFDRADL
jgi:hypothetical protein